MKLYTLQILLFLVSATFPFITGCKRDSPCNSEIINVNISNYDRDKIPYFSFDTLTFIRQPQGDTFTFYGTGWQAYIAEQTEAMVDCPKIYKKEGRKLKFQCPTFSEQITITQQIDINYIDDKTSFISMAFKNTLYKIGSNRLRVLLNSTQKIDSLEINNHWFMNIAKFSDTYDLTNPTNFWCYYNLNSGIIKMELKNGEKWELVKK